MVIAIVMRLFPLFLLVLSAPVYSDIFDMSEHSGIIRDSNGNYSQVSANGSVRSLTSGTTLQVVEKVNFPTSKGVFAADITRNAVVDLARIGKTVRSIAVATGPVGLTISAVSLVCELTTICNDAGQWMMGADPAISGYPSSLPSVGFYYVAGITAYKYPSPETGCSRAASVDKFWGNGYMGVGSGTGSSACTVTNTSNGTTNQTSIQYTTGTCPTNYTINGSTCSLNGNPDAHAPTAADWDSKESLLNDQRFIVPLVTGNHPVPIQAPSIQTPINKPIGKETTTIKDGAGNTTGTEETTTEAQISDPSPAENPSNNPNLIKISETTIKNTYNLNNQLTNSTTTVSDGAQKPEPQSIKIEIDDMQDTPLQTYQVPVTFAYDSWGSGSCPADRSVNYHYGSLNLTFQPACDFAVGMQPVILVVAGMIAMVIVSGVRLND